jgi:hypothetical protein
MIAELGQRDDDDRIGQRRQGGAGAGRGQRRRGRGAERERALPPRIAASSFTIILSMRRSWTIEFSSSKPSAAYCASSVSESSSPMVA